jgi:hypothetical protein
VEERADVTEVVAQGLLQTHLTFHLKYQLMRVEKMHQSKKHQVKRVVKDAVVAKDARVKEVVLVVHPTLVEDARPENKREVSVN